MTLQHTGICVFQENCFVSYELIANWSINSKTKHEIKAVKMTAWNLVNFPHRIRMKTLDDFT